MKQKYLSPELEITVLAVEDILQVSEGGVPADNLWSDEEA